MTVIAVMLVKDEHDVIADVVRHTTTQVDHIVAADNRSIDGTREYLEAAEQMGQLTLVDDPEVGYYQSRKMSRLAWVAGDMGADWVVPVDADEVWAARTGRLGTVLDSMPSEILLAQAVLFDHVPTAKDPSDRGLIPSMGWRQGLPLPLRKVACRYQPNVTLWPGNHGATYPDQPFAPAALDELVVRHFPYRSVKQFVSKSRNGAAAYAATDLPEDTGAHKREFGRVLEERGVAGLEALFFERFYSDDPAADDLVFDPCLR